MRRLDFISATVMLAIAAVVVVGTSGLNFWDGVMPGSRFLPVGVAGAAVLLSLALYLEAWAAPEGQPVDWPGREGIRRVLGATALICALVLLVPWIGFVMGSAFFVLAMLLGIERRPLVPSLVAAAITTGLIYVIFVWWLQVALPKSPLGV